jgi:hypothetical protein
MSFGKFIAFYAKGCGRELWKSWRWTKTVELRFGRTAEGGCPYIDLYVACPDTICPLPYMSGGHLPCALLALYTEILGRDADVT